MANLLRRPDSSMRVLQASIQPTDGPESTGGGSTWYPTIRQAAEIWMSAYCIYIQHTHIDVELNTVTCQLSWRVLTVSELQGNSPDQEALHAYILASATEGRVAVADALPVGLNTSRIV